MATVLLKLQQTDNGKNIVITDVTQWGDTENTGVTHVTSVLTVPSGTEYTIIDEDIDQPSSQSDLVWEISAEDVGFTDVYDDGIYTLVTTFTTSPASDPVTAQIFLDWNLKYYDFQLVKNLSYKLDDGQFAYDQETENSIVFNVLKRNAQYAAYTGQITKCNDILEIANNFKKTQ